MTAGFVKSFNLKNRKALRLCPKTPYGDRGEAAGLCCPAPVKLIQYSLYLAFIQKVYKTACLRKRIKQKNVSLIARKCKENKRTVKSA